MILALIILATFAYTASIIAFGKGPASLDSNLFGAIVNTLGALVPIGMFLLFRPHDRPGVDPHKGIAYALLGGIAIGIFTLAFAKIFSAGENVNFVTPLVYGGAVLLSSLVGILVYKEKASGIVIGGMALIASGIVLIAYSTYLKGAAQ